MRKIPPRTKDGDSNQRKIVADSDPGSNGPWRPTSLFVEKTAAILKLHSIRRRGKSSLPRRWSVFPGLLLSTCEDVKARCFEPEAGKVSEYFTAKVLRGLSTTAEHSPFSVESRHHSKCPQMP